MSTPHAGDEEGRQQCPRHAANQRESIAEESEPWAPETDEGADAEPPASTRTSRREAVHRGKRIVIETTYAVSIDGVPLGVPLAVAQDGSVHCHGLPDYATGSMVDLVKKLVDLSEADAPEDEVSGFDSP